MAMTAARGGLWTVVEYQLIQSRRFWRSIAILSVLTPMMYVLALGVGLGTVVNRHGTSHLGAPYLVYVAPAFLTAAALQIAAAESSYPLMSGFKWQRVFHGMASTPLTPRQVCDGELTWIALRLFVNSALYLAICAFAVWIFRREAPRIAEAL